MDLESYRKVRNLTYEELATLLGMTVGTTFRICKKTGCISLYNAHKIVRIAGGLISYADLLEGDC